MDRIVLKPKKEQSLLRRHPWVFSGAIGRIDGQPKNGDVVEVMTSMGATLGFGHWAEGSIAVRLFSFEKEHRSDEWWKMKLVKAYALRQSIGLTDHPSTTIYRLLNAEGDGMPGLVIDIYGDTAVIQAHSVGMHSLVAGIAGALLDLYAGKLKAVYDKSADKLKKRSLEGNQYLSGSLGDAVALEYGNRFYIDWEEGQKTGFFIDQRENRKRIADFSRDKKVLNAFCYSGGFSIYALQGGAAHVHSVDSSQKALDLTGRNLQLNGYDDSRHHSIKADAVEYIQQLESEFDVMVLDPPAFAKHLSARHQAVQAYRRINEAAIRQVRSGGILFTFSCSQAVDVSLFRGAVTAAAIDAGRSVRVLEKLGQPADHPVSIFHPEGEYLKGLVLQVEDI